MTKPEVSLADRRALIKPCRSGHGRHRSLAFLLCFFPLLSDAAILVSSNAVWRFRKGTNEVSAPIELWRTNTFNDATWPTATAPFSIGESLTVGTILTDMVGTNTANYSGIFLRKTFSITNASLVQSLSLRSLSDDGFVAWINGVEVRRYNISANPLLYTSLADGSAPESLQWITTGLPPPSGYLLTGNNVLTIQAFNRLQTNADFRFDAELSFLPLDSTPPSVASVNPPPGTLSALSQITVGFTEPVTGVDPGDLLLNDEPVSSVSGSGSTYTFSFPQPAYGQLQITWHPSSQITDLASPGNVFDSAASSWTYNLVDTVAPILLVRNPPPGATVQSLNQLEVTFSEPVVGVNAADLLINGQPATNLIAQSASVFLFEFTQPPTGSVQIAWLGSHGIQDLASPPNAFGGGTWSYVLNPNFVEPPVRINEFLAENLNLNGLRDEDGELQDWIEIFNTGSNTVSLFGWSLTDERDEPAKWTFPAVTLGPGEFLVIFASGKDRKPAGAGQNLHTNFRLNSDKDYLGLFNAQSPRVVQTVFDPEFPEQRADYSFGLNSTNAWRYYSTPTPGATNGNSTIVGVVPPVRFNVERGFFSQPFTLILSSPLPGAVIRYTTNGSLPSAVNGLVYSGPLQIRNQTTLRAGAFRTDYLPSSIGTHTYLFLADVVQQPAAPTGFPSTWGSINADYEMDPEVVNDRIEGPLLRQGLTNIPIISIVLNVADMFGPNGIYSNPTARDPAASWERPTSFEVIFADGSPSVQLDAGIQIQGGASRTPGNTSKKSMRVSFKADYGASKLDYRFFPDSPLDRINTLILDAGYNYTWHYSGGSAPPDQRQRAQYIRDQYMADLQNAMGTPAFHGRFVHLYINGLYWGLHGAHERPDEEFAAAYFGGEEIDYDVIRQTSGGVETVNGDLIAFNQMMALANSGLTNVAQYQAMKQYLDVTTFIDYMILNIYGGNTDWPSHNWYALRKREPGAGFKFQTWDAEHVLKSATQNSSTVTFTTGPGRLYEQLRTNSPEFRLAFADRVRKHFFNGGVFYVDPANSIWNPAFPERNVPAAYYMRRVAEIDPAIIGESARWGDTERPTPPYRRSVEFYNELYSLLGWTNVATYTVNYFPTRSANVLNQFIGIGLYTSNPGAPIFNQHGGPVPAGFLLTMTAAGGTIYYTTNGNDPRVEYTGVVDPSARVYSAPLPLNSSVLVKARTFNGSAWSPLTEAQFQVETLDLPLRITEIMYNPLGGDPYEFIEVQNIGTTALDIGRFYFQGIDFIFPPNTVLAPGQIIVLASDLSPSSFSGRYPGLPVFGYFDLNLSNGGEPLVILNPFDERVLSVNYDDENGWPILADGFGYSIELINPFGNPDDPANWRASGSTNGTPGVAPSIPTTGAIRLNEIMAENLSTISNGTSFPDWVEIHNSSASSVNLAGWSLSDDSDPRKFIFPPGSTIAAGSYLIIWCDSLTNSPGLHSGFALGRNGDGVFLFNVSTSRVDAISFGLQLADKSIGVINGNWVLNNPTPGSANVAAVLGSASALFINEWLASPPTGTDDWLEIFNSNSNAPVSLEGVYLSSNNIIHQLGSLSYIGAGGFIRLWADEGVGADHLDFKLDEGGGSIRLFTPTAQLINSIVYGAQTNGVSEGRLPDGSATIVRFAGSASPGASNYQLVYTGPRLNEVFARNLSYTNTAGQISDWIELQNPGGSAFDLSGMSLSVDAFRPGQWFFPSNTVIAAAGYLVISCDSSRPTTTNASANLNSGESLSGEGGGVYLFNTLGQRVDSVEYGFQVNNLTIGKIGGQWRLLAAPTPGGINASAALLGSTSGLLFNEWMAEPLSGNDWFEIYNTNNQPVELSGLFLSDDPSILGQAEFRIPPLSFIGARGFVEWVADGEVEDGPNHVSFALDGGGEMLRVYNSTGGIIHEIYFGLQAAGVSQGYLPDGTGSLVSFPSTATPGESNYLPLQNIGINEVLSHTDPPLEDAIELRNLTGANVNVGNWYLSDSPDEFRKYRIGAGTLLPANAFAVFYQAQFNGGAGSLIPFTLDSVRGDAVWLSEGDANGNLTGFRTRVEFGASANGISFGTYLTSLGEQFVAMGQRTLGRDNPTNLTEFRLGTGKTNAYPKVGPIVVNEIMYRPPDLPGTNDNAIDEFIELRNIAATNVSLFDPAASTNKWKISGGVEFVFQGNISLPPDGYLLLVGFDPTNSAMLAAFNTRYAVPTNVPVVGPFEGKLNNSGERIELLKPDPPQTSGPDAGFVPYVLVEAIDYRDQLPWPVAADGTGASLQRKFGNDFGNDPVNWKGEGPTAGRGTSGVSGVAPTITSHPLTQSVVAGSNVTFNVAASGSLPFTYQWQKAGANIQNATNSSLLITNAGPSDAAVYSVVVANGSGFAISDGATLTVLLPVTIAQHPQSLAVRAGSNVNFTVNAAGTAPLFYQWRFNGQPLAGKTNNPIQLTNVQSQNEGVYDVVVSNWVNSVISDTATLVVQVPAFIIQQPQNISVPAGSNAIFSVVAWGTLPLQYQWRFNGAPLAGATNDTLTLNTVEPDNVGSYQVMVSNIFGSELSVAASLRIGVPLRLEGFGLNTNGLFQFRVSGPPQTNYLIQASSNLNSWFPLSTNFAPTGSLQYVDPATPPPLRFYRALLWP